MRWLGVYNFTELILHSTTPMVPKHSAWIREVLKKGDKAEKAIAAKFLGGMRGGDTPNTPCLSAAERQGPHRAFAHLLPVSLQPRPAGLPTHLQLDLLAVVSRLYSICACLLCAALSASMVKAILYPNSTVASSWECTISWLTLWADCKGASSQLLQNCSQTWRHWL